MSPCLLRLGIQVRFLTEVIVDTTSKKWKGIPENFSPLELDPLAPFSACWLQPCCRHDPMRLPDYSTLRPMLAQAQSFGEMPLSLGPNAQPQQEKPPLEPAAP